MSRFNQWWRNFGSGVQPLPEEDVEEFAHRICALAWEGGASAQRDVDAGQVEKMGMQGFATLAIAASIRAKETA